VLFVRAAGPASRLQPATGFSPESRELPKGSLHEYPWNPAGRGLTFQRFQFPIVAVSPADGAWLRSLALKNAARGYGSFPQYAVSLSFYMGPADLDSYKCLDAGSCLPLGGQSVWGSMGPLDAAPPLSESAPQRRLMGGAAAEAGEGGGQAVAAPIAQLGAVQKQWELAKQRAQRRRQHAAADRSVEQSLRQLLHRAGLAAAPSSDTRAELAPLSAPVGQGATAPVDTVSGWQGLWRTLRSLVRGGSVAAVEPPATDARVANYAERPDDGAPAGAVDEGKDWEESKGRRLASAARSQRPVVMAVTAMDSSALFHDLAWGADSSVSAVVALLAAADALSRTDAYTLPHQILFGLFQAEQWGRVGSRRWVQEVQGFTCLANVSAAASPNGRPFCANPLRTDLTFSSLRLLDVQYVLAVDQVGHPGLPSLFLHEFDRSSVVPDNRTFQVFDALGHLPSGALPLPVARAGDTPVPPPTPLLSFQETTPPLTIDGAVLSGYDLQFATTFFHSEFDNASQIDAGVVANAATAVAKGLYALATNASTPAAAAALVPQTLVANASLVAEMVQCITVNARCALFQSVLGVDAATLAALVPAGPLGLYTSVYNQPYTLSGNGYVLQPTPLEAFVRNLLGKASALPSQQNGTCANTQDCQQRLSKAYECLVGTCVIANSYYHDALSPALASTASYGSYSVNRQAIDPTIDPLWTEPYWSSNIGAKAFLKDSPVADGIVLGFGLAATLAAIAGSVYLVRFLDKHYKVP